MEDIKTTQSKEIDIPETVIRYFIVSRHKYNGVWYNWNVYSSYELHQTKEHAVQYFNSTYKSSKDEQEIEVKLIEVKLPI